LYFGKRVYFDNDENAEAVDDVLKKMLKTETLDYNNHADYNMDDVKRIVSEKYLARNKLKQLLSHLSVTKEILDQI
jgi:hypothetical protein